VCSRPSVFNKEADIDKTGSGKEAVVNCLRLLLYGLFAVTVNIAPEYGSFAAYASGPQQIMFTAPAGLRDAV